MISDDNFWVPVSPFIKLFKLHSKIHSTNAFRPFSIEIDQSTLTIDSCFRSNLDAYVRGEHEFI